MKTMISKVGHVYDGRALAPGEAFEVHDEYVNALELLGRAELAHIESGAGQQYRTRDMVAAAPAENGDVATVAAPRPKRKYNTKRQAV